MERKKATLYDADEFPDVVELRIYPDFSTTKLYSPLNYCYIDVVINKDQEAIGSSRCSKCKGLVELFTKFCPHCGAKVKGRRLLRKKEQTDDKEENSPICL